MDSIFAIIESSIFKSFVISPLAVIGFYQIFRGVVTIVEKDLTEREWIKGWMIVAYLLITVLGCLCLIVAL